MRIIKEIDKQVVVENLKTADNIITRLIGLLNKSSLNDGEGLLIKPCRSIHSIGMKFVFDAVFLDKDNKVVYIIHEMHPMRISPIVSEAVSVLEIPAAAAKRTCLAIGDKLEIVE